MIGTLRLLGVFCCNSIIDFEISGFSFFFLLPLNGVGPKRNLSLYRFLYYVVWHCGHLHMQLENNCIFDVR